LLGHPHRSKTNSDYLLNQPHATRKYSVLTDCADGPPWNANSKKREPQTLLSMVGADLGVTLIPSRIGCPGVVFLSIHTNPPSANLYITYTTLDDAPVVRIFLNILKSLVKRNKTFHRLFSCSNNSRRLAYW
jgi:DNA-binding transcriptional LysR family regulator